MRIQKKSYRHLRASPIPTGTSLKPNQIGRQGSHTGEELEVSEKLAGACRSVFVEPKDSDTNARRPTAKDDMGVQIDHRMTAGFDRCRHAKDVGEVTEPTPLGQSNVRQKDFPAKAIA